MTDDNKIRIMSWNFDFQAMTGQIIDDGMKGVEFLLHAGPLGLYYKENHHACPKLVANTGNKLFDDAVKRAWSTYLFERDVLNSK